jgi:Ras-related protein Rab-4B
VYDVSSRESFNSLANWLTDARTLASPAILILLVGNKKDLEDEREVTFLEASRCVKRTVACDMACCGFGSALIWLSWIRILIKKIRIRELQPTKNIDSVLIQGS